jgi:hypothetical protein
MISADSEIEQPEAWIGATWLGYVPYAEVKKPRVRVIYRLLDDLVAVGVANRSSARRGWKFNLTLAAMPFFFDGNELANNPLREPFLCYSEVVPEKVLSVQTLRDGDTLMTFPGTRAPVRPGPTETFSDILYFSRLRKGQGRAVLVRRHNTWLARSLCDSRSRVANGSVWE